MVVSCALLVVGLFCKGQNIDSLKNVERFIAFVAKGDSCWKAIDSSCAEFFWKEARKLHSSCDLSYKLSKLHGIMPHCDVDVKYKAAITMGDKRFLEKDYSGAKAAYSEAIASMPEKKYPKNKIAECDYALSNGLKKNPYQAAIVVGQELFHLHKYSEAKEQFLLAKKLDPKATYPKERLADIDSIYSIARTYEYYSENISWADEAFQRKDYKSAKYNYENALKYKPHDIYAKDKIDACDSLIKMPKPKKITFHGETKNGKYWTGKEYVYDKDGVLTKIKLYKEGKYVGDAKIEDN